MFQNSKNLFPFRQGRWNDVIRTRNEVGKTLAKQLHVGDNEASALVINPSSGLRDRVERSPGYLS